MFSETDPGNHDYTGNSNSGQLLREIEAISNALHLRRPPRKALLFPADQERRSASKTRFYETKAKPKPEFLREDEPVKERKISSAWNWKKPLKSFAHIGHRKFSCSFNLHIHSTDGLPPHFDDASIRVNWKRKDDISQTSASTVFNGMAEFNQTLTLKCSVYGRRSGPNYWTEYEPELFMIYVSVNGVPRLDIGKHWIDVTRLLPPTIEDLEGEKSSGRWTRSFKLFGKANGALLHVSFGYLMMKNGHLKDPILTPTLELSESIDFLYQKLDLVDFCDSALLDFDFSKQMYLEPDPKFESEKETKQDLHDKTEFTVVDCGIEIEAIDKKMERCSMNNINSKYVDKVVKDENGLLVTKSILDCVDSPSERMVSARREPSLAGESIALQGSSSLDVVNESVISEFLSTLGLECGDEYNDNFDFAPHIRVREEHKSASQLRNRRKAQILENLETEALMQKWGMKEKDFQYSPRCCSAGFGSPIELPKEDPLKSPSLAEGCGSLVQLKGGGFLRSMNPALFKYSRNERRLIIQLSQLVVLPAEMGSHFAEILQCFASIGADKLYMQINKLMPMEDLNGKTIPQIEVETASTTVGYERKSLFQHNEAKVDCISPKDLIHLAMDKIEVLSLEGLKIHSDMSNDDVPSQISLSSQSSDAREIQRSSSDVEGLMDLSLTLEEWLKLDAGIIGNNSSSHESFMKTLVAHHAKSIDAGRIFTRDVKMIGEASMAGLMGSSLTLALMLQLKDPLRNLEPVGCPMLCLIQVERVDNELVSDSINDIHLLGVKCEPGREHVWGTAAQQVSGTRWLLSNGIRKTFRHPYSKTRSIERSSSTAAKMKQKDVLWSISSHVDGKKWEKLIFGHSHTRNPDLISQNK